MSYPKTLNLRTVQVARETVTPDGMGGSTTTTVLTTLGKASLWQTGARDSYLSDQLLAVSTHVLACRPSDDILLTDKVVYKSKTYTVEGHPQDVANRSKVQIVALKLVN